MQRIVVTGGAGFIGSHLVNKLIQDGSKVLVIDNLTMGSMNNLYSHHNLTLSTKSILDDDIDFFFNGVDVVYHLAALTRPRESFIYPEETTRVNVLGTLKVLNKSVQNGVKRFVFVSTTELYGVQSKFPTPETATPNPSSPYGVSKLVGEEYCKLYGKLHGIEYNIIRPFNVYGPKQSLKGGYAAAVPKFINDALHNKESQITGDGSQSRDFIFVDDVVELLTKAGESKVHGEIFNAGSGVSTSINELHETILNMTGKVIGHRHVDPVVEPPRTQGDISKANKLMDWKPSVDLEKGLTITIRKIIDEQKN